MTNREAFERGIKNWANSVQSDRSLKALSDIKVIVDKFYEKGYTLEWELNETIYAIEDIARKNNDENGILEEILEAIRKYFETAGRMAEAEVKPKKEILFEEIRKIIGKAKIPANYLTISKLMLD